ncbi:phenazine biosynthesis protein [Rhodospirillum rubrum]|uniref:PhzF family phenazine biosynthesis protein n=1 Tax=Rhodospirillum rubrum TaxID=1085 RepID=UPI001907ACD4|nr:PhzF family phenazine biosynthesis protein [Rhodospirillum rubrum]MBK1664863.1 phenazine biosynthesis protein [Rhodospirillum rubrum]MBK1676296.1 phenazine biosynthesis protein [Rhodospirillum rubrum]
MTAAFAAGPRLRVPFFQVDAFADVAFAGNPAAVCLLEKAWPEDELLQAIAAENNLSETAFVVRGGQNHALRWFTPLTEVPLCGHATLASGHVLLRELGACGPQRFDTRAGMLEVSATDEGALAMRLPAKPPKSAIFPEDLDRVLGVRPMEVAQGGEYLIVVLGGVEVVRSLRPRLSMLRAMGIPRLVVTAAGGGADSAEACDFASRVFAPGVGIDEDPVTGSAHCVLTPFWAKRLGRPRLLAHQVSPRGGRLVCTLMGAEVEMIGQAVTVISGTLSV